MDDLPNNDAGPNGETFADLIPLRLVLLPTGYGVELNRPEMILGRHSGADIRLPLPDVSRRHCRFAFRDGRWHLDDLNSLNGTCVNGQFVQHAVLRDGDTIRFGELVFGVRLRAAVPALPVPARSGSGEGVLARIAKTLPPAGPNPVRRAS
jgi:pSer/pThr/pTyr-binding forkhead associated (FHA) protein